MAKKLLLLLFVTSTLLLVGCSTSETPKTDSGPAAGNANSATSTTAPPKTATASAEKVGIPECDDFITAYDACINDKVPEVARAQYKTGIEQWRSSWRKMAENPQTRASLVAACKQSAEQTRIAMKSYGCTF